jgi:transcription initiation factor TFIID subunit 1
MMQYELSDDEPELESLDISNDHYYLPLSDRVTPIERKLTHEETLQIPKYGSRTIRHSLPAYDLWKAFFPTYLSDVKFQNFHRPKLRHYNNGPQARDRRGFYKEHPVKNLTRNIFRHHMQTKSKVIKAINNRMSREDIVSKFLQIKSARELSAKDGELYLFEYCEEFPPVLSRVGMASNVKTYIYGPDPSTQRLKGNSSQCDRQVATKPCIGFEEFIKSERQSKMIYYNALKRGVRYTFIENNLYRAPIFEHELPSCDFLVVRTRNSYYIRQVKTIFTVGQELPLISVPPPNETNIQKFRCDLSNVYIHKLFKASDTNPPSLNPERLTKLFPDYHRSMLLKRLTHSGARAAYIHNEKVIIQGARRYADISLKELRAIMRPETYCANMSMLAARQRLRELNYTESMIFPDKKQNVELEPEVLAAPWNTTKAVDSFLKSRSYLDLERHLIDPTGPAREGFSCVAWVKSPTELEQTKEINRQNSQPRPTNAPFTFDKNPKRQQITQEKLRRLAIYQKAAQMIEEVQRDILSKDDAITSSEDEGDVNEDSENLLESDFSQQLEDLSKLVIDGRTDSELSHEKEEEERRQLLADLRLNNGVQGETRTATQQEKKSDDLNLASLKNKILMITRTYDHNGVRIQRTEVVREPRIIALYVKKKGGSLTNKTSGEDNCNGDQLCTNNNLGGGDRPRSRSSSLGPSELCRTDGTRLWISRKVLKDVCPVRSTRRQSSIG